jgi:hypothetical protein
MLAGELREGDVLRSNTGQYIAITKMERVYLDEPILVYNFEVEDWHTYFVSESMVLVHNSCAREGGIIREPTYYGNLSKVNNPDPAANKLAARLNGQSTMKFASHDREFDAISDLYIAQTKPGRVTNGSSLRNQFKGTFEAAIDNRKIPYFHFEGPPSENIIDILNAYSKRYGISYVLDKNPLF